MRTNTALAKMRAGEVAYGYALGLGSPVAAEMLAHTGVDFLLLDNQHGSWGAESTIAGLAVMAGSPTTPMARVARNDYTMIGRMLDEGALGIIVPMVDTPEQAKAAADACRFLPTGTRSWGWGRAGRYGADYPTRINDEVFVAVQLESTLAVENAEAIMATPGIDGCWVGPGDLALSLGVHPDNYREEASHQKALDQILQACRNTGKIPGFAAFTPEDAAMRAAQGWLYLTAGDDVGFLHGAGVAGMKHLRG